MGGRAHNIERIRIGNDHIEIVPESGRRGSRQKGTSVSFFAGPGFPPRGRCPSARQTRRGIAKQDLGHPGTIHIDRHPGIKRREFKPCREEQRAGGATSPSFCRVSFPPQVFFRIFLPARGETAPIAYPAVRARTPHSGTAADPWGGIPGLASSPGLKGCWGPVRGGGCTPAR